MKAAEINTTLVDGYLKLLDNLNPVSKLDLIAKLKASAKTHKKDRKKIFKNSFGAFESSKSAEEIIKEIRESRTFNRQIESF